MGVVFISALLLGSILQGPAWAGTGGTVVVLDVEGPGTADMGELLTAEIHGAVLEKLAGQPYSLMTRERTDLLVAKHGSQIDLEKCRARENCEVAFGRRMVAEMVLASTLGIEGDNVVLDLRMVAVRTGQVLASRQLNAADTMELVGQSATAAAAMVAESIAAAEEAAQAAQAAANAPPPPPPPKEPEDPTPEPIPQPEAPAQKPAQPGEVAQAHGVRMLQVPTAASGAGQGTRLLVSDIEVPQGLYRAIIGSNPSYFSSCGAECPVEEVSWFEAVDLCNGLSAAEGLSPAYEVSGGRVRWDRDANGYRLLTSGEWSTVAAADLDHTYAGSNSVREVGWTVLNGDEQTHLPRRLRPNAWGLYDMSGNVAEWVWSASGSERQIRGGSFEASAIHAAVGATLLENPRRRSKDIGFRLARTARPSQEP